MKILKTIGMFLLKNWKWIVPMLAIVIWIISPTKHWITFGAGFLIGYSARGFIEKKIDSSIG